MWYPYETTVKNNAQDFNRFFIGIMLLSSVIWTYLEVRLFSVCYASLTYPIKPINVEVWKASVTTTVCLTSPYLTNPIYLLLVNDKAIIANGYVISSLLIQQLPWKIVQEMEWKN